MQYLASVAIDPGTLAGHKGGPPTKTTQRHHPILWERRPRRD